jgi:hypothetical protein
MTERKRGVIKIYGIKATAGHPEYGKVTKRAEIPAGSAAEAQGYMRGWCIVQGYDVSAARFDVETDGMTYRERMTRDLTDAGARLSLRYGATVVGPFEREPRYQGDEPRSIMRLTLSNGWGVSLSSKLSDCYSVDTEMVTGYEHPADEWRTDFGPGVMEYESRIFVAEEYDDEIGQVLVGLAKLPNR